ncbi:GNAT family N-acetyltransferase [Dactylosporangium matsuzakiense]|uniref:GNAT family N-acetyltransferase n=1 Tax=Dactylosporangium matsuzakiense TaxID=53360 RepID=UPI0021C4BE28|nr:GNAT family N-acetyltransferase [Dactylosporangium matsuzakiense]UWZ49017.1 GNAT family N-acetyltransferase [Dactylosporangium matsuzakiense]
MAVRPLTGDDWRLKRDMRLAALKDSPAAFISTYAREAKRSELDWRSWPAGGAFFAAFGPPPGLRRRAGCDVPLGIAAAWVAAARPATTHLISMWVVPAARGNGIAAQLADAVTGWAAGRGHRTVELEIACGNTAALRAYLRCGFTPTGREPFTGGGTVLVRTVGR